MLESINALRREVCRNGSDGTVRLVADHIGKIEQEIKERYIELPKDVNDIPVHIGDVLQEELCDGGWCNPFKVISMKIGENGWEVCDVYGYRHRPNLCRHKSTVEDVLWELLGSIRPEMEDDEAVPIVRKFAKRLQLLEGE